MTATLPQATQDGAFERRRLAGVSLLVRAGTNGLPLVLLHGIGSNAETWRAAMAACAPASETVAWDAPGYGASDRLARLDPTPADYAQALLAVLDAAGHERIVLAGHSLGALFAGRFAAAYPHRVAGVALLSPALGYRGADGAPLPPPVQARLDELERLGAAAFAAARATRLVYRPETKPEIVAGVRRAMGAVTLPGYAQAARALGAGDLLADAPLIEAPTLVATGTEDVVTPPAGAHALHALLRNAIAFEEVAGIGHALPQEAPDLVAALLARLAEAAHG